MMSKKISVLLVESMLVMTSIIIVTNNDDVLANQEPENDMFDFQLIHDVTQYLSWRINQSYDIEHGELAKGRYFGSKGEHDAAEYIARKMGDFGLIDLNYSALSYRQQIGEDYNNSLEILDRNLTLHHGNETKYLNDFYISPQWGIKKPLQPYDYENLSQNHSYTNLQISFLPIFNWSIIFDDFLNITLTQEFFDDLLDNETPQDEDQFDDYLTTLFENYYNFTFLDILDHPENATALPWYDESLFNYTTDDYVAIAENPGFNPNMSYLPSLELLEKIVHYASNWLSERASEYGYDIGTVQINELQPWWHFIKSAKKRFIAGILCALPRCKGIILFDSNNDSFDSNPNNKIAIPVIYINGTLGNQINQSREDYRIDFRLNQSWNDSVESYNVIGQINGSDPNKTILIECLYDSLWCQGTADSAIGCGMVLALAKYMKQLETQQGIIPKQNVRFILFGGEEAGIRGAEYYENQSDENITTVIDLNQLGFDQRAPPVSLIMNVATNKLWFKPILQDITDITDYMGRENDNTQFRVSWTPIGSLSDEQAFAKKFIGRPFLKTVMFLKDMNWTRHHRDGENHTTGDTMDYYDQDDIELTMEMIWNVTRFLIYQPDCWLEDVAYTYTDGDDQNTYDDTVNASFTIHTAFPEDKVTVKLILIPKYLSNPLNPGYPILYRYRTEKEFIVTPEGTSGYITLQLPKGAPHATYKVHLILLNSTGDTLVDNIGKGWSLAQGTQKTIDFFKSLINQIDVNCTETLMENSDEISTDFNLDIMEFIDRFPFVEKFRDLITDFLTIYSFSDDRDTDLTSLSPPNDPPIIPQKPVGPTHVVIYQENEYTTKSTDPNDDQVEYKWRFHLGDRIFNYNKWSSPCDSGEDHTQSNTWYLPGFRWVYVKARDTWHSPNVQSDYSGGLRVRVSLFSWINAPTEQLVDESVQFNGYLNGAQPYQLK